MYINLPYLLKDEDKLAVAFEERDYWYLPATDGEEREFFLLTEKNTLHTWEERWNGKEEEWQGCPFPYGPIMSHDQIVLKLFNR